MDSRINKDEAEEIKTFVGGMEIYHNVVSHAGQGGWMDLSVVYDVPSKQLTYRIRESKGHVDFDTIEEAISEYNNRISKRD